MKIDNIQIYGLHQSMVRSGYPMATEIEVHVAETNDMHRAFKLGNAPAGSGHDNFLKGIIVQCDIEAPSYWWPQFQRYHFADIISSQSKMHKITQFDLEEQCSPETDWRIIQIAIDWIDQYKDGKCDLEDVLSNIPQGLELTAAVTTNYLQLKTMYAQRKNHKLKMWNTVFREFVEGLPYAVELGVTK